MAQLQSVESQEKKKNRPSHKLQRISSLVVAAVLRFGKRRGVGLHSVRGLRLFGDAVEGCGQSPTLSLNFLVKEVKAISDHMKRFCSSQLLRLIAVNRFSNSIVCFPGASWRPCLGRPCRLLWGSAEDSATRARAGRN